MIGSENQKYNVTTHVEIKWKIKLIPDMSKIIYYIYIIIQLFKNIAVIRIKNSKT